MNPWGTKIYTSSESYKHYMSHLRCSELVMFQGSWKNLQIVFTPTFRNNCLLFFSYPIILVKLMSELAVWYR